MAADVEVLPGEADGFVSAGWLLDVAAAADDELGEPPGIDPVAPEDGLLP